MLVRLASPPLLLVSALDPSNHSRPRRTVPADCALPTYPAFVHAVPIHTATFTRFLWDCPISLLRRKTHIRAYTPVTPRVASLSARRNDKCANIRTQMPLFASLCAHGRRFGAHLGTLSSYAIPNPASRSGIRGKSASLGVSRPRHARPKIVSTISSTFSATINATTIMKITCLTVPSTHSPISSLVCV